MDALSRSPSPEDGPTSSVTDPLTVGLVVAALAAVSITFAPWHHSGSATRNSYELLASVDRLGIVDGALNRTLAAAWPLVPLAMALGGVALALGRKVLGAVLMLVAAILEVLGAVIVLRADTTLRWGPWAAVAVGLATAVLAILVAVAAGLSLSATKSGADR